MVIAETPEGVYSEPMKQRTTISEIAAQLGVSPSTVSRALHNSPTISAQRKAEVWKLAESLGLRIEKPSGNQARHCSGIIACVVPSISHPFFVDIIEKLEGVCAQRGYDLLLRSSNATPAIEYSIVEDLIEKRVDGVMFIPSSTDMTPLRTCVENLKTVVITQLTPLCPSIGINHEEGGRQVAEHFKEIGKHACLLIGPPNDPKFNGFRSYIETEGITNFSVQNLNVDGWDARYIFDTRQALLDRFDTESIRRFDCVFAKTDLAAIGAYHALHELGVSIPDQIAVCGFDDTPLARAVYPALSSVAQPVGQIVNFGVSLLTRLFDVRGEPFGPTTYTLKPNLVVRGSTFLGR